MHDTLVSRHANEAVRELYAYLRTLYGHGILSGQQMYGPEGYEAQTVYQETGKLAALRGYDFLCLEEGLGDDHQVTDAIRWHKQGGIVTFCWHWMVPTDPQADENGSAFTGAAFYSDRTEFQSQTSFDVTRALQEGTKENRIILRHIRNIAAQIKRLEQAGVPILWRPLHEASGQWFWWGAKGAHPYKKLWDLLFHQLEDVYQCGNLIWVWNGQSPEWMVDKNTVDIGGEDIYPGEHIYSSHKERFDLCARCVGPDRMIALSENGCLCDPDALLADGVPWLWWCVWWGDFVFRREADGRLVYQETYTDVSMLRHVYHHPYVKNLDDLPHWSWLD